MNKKEKTLLKRITDHPEGLLYPILLFNIIGENKSNKEIHKLISEGYIEEIPSKTPLGRTVYTGYRISKKGHSVFFPIYKKLFSFFQGDIRTVIISAITTLVTILITKLFK